MNPTDKNTPASPAKNPGKTSTGMPINQSFTPPTGQSVRPAGAIQPPEKNVFLAVFPEMEENKRPNSVTINKDITAVQSALSNVANFPQFFEGLSKVENVSQGEAVWHLKGEDQFSVKMHHNVSQSGNMMTWKSEDAVGFPYTLAIYLEPAQAGRGTIVRIMTSHDTNTGSVVGIIEKMFGKDPAMNAKKNLLRFKAFVETGHVPTIEGQPSGRDEDSKVITNHTESTTKH